MNPDFDLSTLSHAERDALILALSAGLDAALGRIDALQSGIDGLTRPSKTPDNSNLPPSTGQKSNRADNPKGLAPRKGSLGRKGGGRELSASPDETVTARPTRSQYCKSALAEADQRLEARYDKIELPEVRPTVTRVERYAGRCQRCGGATQAAVPEGLEPGTPFKVNIVALALYLRIVHAFSYKRLGWLRLELYGLTISEDALDAALRRGQPCFDADVATVLARLRRARVICSDRTSVHAGGRTRRNWVFQNDEVVIHVIRAGRGAVVVAKVLDGHRPVIWVSDLYGAQQDHAETWQVCLAHQLYDRQYAIDAR